MDLLPFVLVVCSAVTHAYWNFLVKKSEDKDLFLTLSKITEIVIFLLPFMLVLFYYGINFEYWYFIIVASLFVFLNYYFLGKAYKHVDLSVAYPLSRASTLFLPLIAYLCIQETINAVGVLSVILVTIGVLIINLGELKNKTIGAIFTLIKNPGTLLALLAALTVASYTVWDKIAIRQIHPFLYFYLYTFLTALFFAVKAISRYRTKFLIQSWSISKWSILQVAFFNTFTYLLVLVALSLSKATYVGALRQLSLIFGVYLGWKFLKEKITVYRVVGVILIFIGGILVLIAK